MNEGDPLNNDNFPLVRRPSSAVEKAAPGAKRILSSMVADALALKKRQPVKRIFSVAVCGTHNGVDDYLLCNLQERLADGCVIQSSYFTYSEDLLNAFDQKPFDLFVIFLNPNFPSKIEKPDVRKFIADLKAKFHIPVIIIANYMENRPLLEPVADAFLPMPFGFEDVRLALTMCGFSNLVEVSEKLSKRRPLKIVHVDDEEMMLRVIETVIADNFKGVIVKSFQNSREAWRELSITHMEPDLLVTDDKMPSLTGEDIVQRLVERNVKYPIIVTSGWGPTEQWVQKYNDKNITFLRFPCTWEEFLKVLSGHLGSKLQFKNNEP